MVPFNARALLLLAGVTLLPRLILAAALGISGRPERWEYDVIAENILRGAGHVYDRDGFVYAAYSPPLWSYLLAAALRLAGGSRAVIQVLQALLCLGAALTFGGMAHRISGDRKTGLLAGLLVAAQPSLLYYSVVKSDPLPLNVLLLGLILASASALSTRPTRAAAITFGVRVGLGTLSRGTPVVALPVALSILLIRGKGAALRTFALALGSFVLVLAPWLVRNWMLLGTPLITSTAGENFWNGNHGDSYSRLTETEGGAVTQVTPSNPRLPEEVRRILAGGSEADRNQAFTAEAWRFIAAHPREAVLGFGRKLRTFWWRIDSDPRDYPAAASLAYEVIYRIELCLALFGVATVWLSRRREPRPPDLTAAALALGLMASISLLQSAFYVQGRHRFMIEPLLLIFTAQGATSLSRRLNRGETRE